LIHIIWYWFVPGTILSVIAINKIAKSRLRFHSLQSWVNGKKDRENT